MSSFGRQQVTEQIHIQMAIHWTLITMLWRTNAYFLSNWNFIYLIDVNFFALSPPKENQLIACFYLLLFVKCHFYSYCFSFCWRAKRELVTCNLNSTTKLNSIHNTIQFPKHQSTRAQKPVFISKVNNSIN